MHIEYIDLVGSIRLLCIYYMILYTNKCTVYLYTFYIFIVNNTIVTILITITTTITTITTTSWSYREGVLSVRCHFFDGTAR